MGTYNGNLQQNALERIEELEADNQRLSDALASMIGWAGEVSDEYLDGDPDVRAAYRADMKEARAALRGEAAS